MIDDYYSLIDVLVLPRSLYPTELVTAPKPLETVANACRCGLRWPGVQGN